RRPLERDALGDAVGVDGADRVRFIPGRDQPKEAVLRPVNPAVADAIVRRLRGAPGALAAHAGATGKYRNAGNQPNDADKTTSVVHSVSCREPLLTHPRKRT